jgi:hypothetical protein
MEPLDLFHIIEEGLEDRFVFRTLDGEVFDRPRRIEVQTPVDPVDPTTCRIEMDDGVYIRPLDEIASIEAAP